MAFPARIGVRQITVNGTTSGSPAWPTTGDGTATRTIAAGDLAVMSGGTTFDTTKTDPGWNGLTQPGGKQKTWWKIVTADDLLAAPTFAWNVNSDARIILAVYEGHDPTTPIPLESRDIGSDDSLEVVRTNGEYATYVNPLYTVLEDADDIRLPDGTIGKAVFLGGHRSEVTAEIKDELVAAGFSVDQEEVA